MNKRKISFVYRLLVIVSLSSGIALNLYHTTSVASMLSYYTLQINVMCLIAFIIFEIADIAKRNYRKHELYYAVKGTLIVAVSIMAIVYKIALAPNNFAMDSLQKCIENKQIANFLVHELSPILVMFDYFLFDDKGNFKLYYPIIWLFVPLNYVVYVYSYSAGGGNFYGLGGSREFAYFFLDYKQIGYLGVFKWMSFMTILILVLGCVFVFIDNKLAKRQKKNMKKRWE